MFLFDTLNPFKNGDLRPKFGVKYFAEGEGGGEGGEKPWFDTLSDTLKTDQNITKYKSLEEFANGHLNAVKLVGAKGVIVPKEGAAPEEFDKFYNALGRPEKEDGYKLTTVEGLHKDIQITPEAQKAFAGIAHKLGLTNSQADGLNKHYMALFSQALAQRDIDEGTRLKELSTKLQQKWGSEYKQNLVMAQRVLEKVGNKGMVEKYLGANGDPELIESLANLGKLLSEDNVHIQGFSHLAADATEAKRKINEIMNNTGHAYWKENDPGHAHAVEEMRKLHQIAEGQL